jgi:hypothetical protein
MIIKLFTDAMYALIYVITSPIRLLPDVSLPIAFTNAITTANGYISSINTIIPVDTIILLIKLYIVIELAYFTYKLIMWLIKRFPTQS